MNILKKFNLLDWIIIISFLLLVCLAVYNFLPRGDENKYKISFLVSDGGTIKEGDLCTDSENNGNLGRVSGVEGSSFYIISEVKKGEHGIEINGKTYLENMPLRLWVGNCYAEAEIRLMRYAN